MSEQRTEGAGETPPTETGNGETLAEQLKGWAEHFVKRAEGLESDGNERLACYNHGQADAMLQAARMAEEHESRWQADRAAWEAKENALLGKCAEWELHNYDGFADAVREILSNTE